jgi:hypothetical protein
MDLPGFCAPGLTISRRHQDGNVVFVVIRTMQYLSPLMISPPIQRIPIFQTMVNWTLLSMMPAPMA